MSDQPRGGFAGIGLSGAVFLLFLYLKLTDQIDWAWVWVCAPLWIPLAIAIPFVIIAAVLIGRR